MLKLEEKQKYKFTEEFGNIPSDWGYDRLYKYCSIGTGNGNTQDSEKDGIYPFYVRSPIIERSNKYIFDGEAVLTVGDGVGTGKVFHYINGKFNFHQRVYKMSDFKRLNGKFFYYFFSTYFGNRVNQMTAKSSVDSVRLEMISNMKILLPSTFEQEKIAEVLSDIDELIESIQKLIDKKRDLKIATMQKLFIPKSHWITKTIGNICYILDNLRIPLNEYQREPGQYPYCGANGVVDYIDKWCIDEDIILIAEDGGYFDEYATRKIAYKMSGKCWVNNHAHILQAKPGYSQELIYQMLVHKNITNYITGGTRAKLNKEVLLKIEFILPINISEQQQIANTLSEMDSEIEALEKELHKYKDLKTSITQVLLTGKIRLVNNSNKNTSSNVVQIDTTTDKQSANNEFKDAVIISMLTYKFGNPKYPLGAFRRQKLSYLFKRHHNIPINEYEKKAMGPYNPKIKYRGGEGIAIRNKYVKKVGERGLVSDNAILKAEEYFNKYYSRESLSWLESNFKFAKNEDLEVLATVDYAIVELRSQNKSINLENIKSYISSDEEWKPKLQKDFFNDKAILNAMNKSKTLLNSY